MNEVLLKHYLKTLRLPTMLREYAEIARQCGEQGEDHLTYLEALARCEVAEREAKGIARRLRQANFPVVKELADFDFSVVPQVNKSLVLELSRGEFVDQKTNLILLGQPGVGKSHLSIALGRELCRRGKRVKFFTAAGLVNTYVEAREAREVRRLEAHIGRHDLIVIDELGYLPFSQNGAENLFGFFSQCYEQTSLIVTTNLPFAEWPQIFGGDERLTGALLDRLTHRVHIMDIQGESYRLRDSLQAREGGEVTATTKAE